MPAGRRAVRAAVLAEAQDALGTARCAARLAGEASDDFAVRELLLSVLSELERAERALRRLGI